MGGLYNTGQDCTCGSRIYVQSSVYDKFLAIFKEKIMAYKLGNGFDADSSAGPLVSSFSQDPKRAVTSKDLQNAI